MKSLLVVLLFLGAAHTVCAKDQPQNVKLEVTEEGFKPSEIKVKPGAHVILKVTRKTDATCATQIKITDQKKKTDLPLNKEVSIDLGTLKKGDIRFACGMDMITGHIVVE
jgi:plastocyanin domain-containing protein